MESRPSTRKKFGSLQSYHFYKTPIDLKKVLMFTLVLNLDEYYIGTDGEPDQSYKDRKEYRIMYDFLQPDSVMCLEAAANSLLDLIPDHCGPSGVVGIIILCANVIPWHHTSHLKLAYLSECLRWSPKMSPSLGDIKASDPIILVTDMMLTISQSASDSYLTNVSFSDALWDGYDNAGMTISPTAPVEILTEILLESYGPDKQSDLDQWVNFNAFLANLDALNFWSGESLYVYRTMAYAFKHPPNQFEDYYKDPNDDQVCPNGRDANVVAAAQWILWDGQNVRRHAIYKGPPALAMRSGERYFNLERATTSLERWELWKEGFKTASQDRSASHECQSVAIRASALMEALGKTMPS